MNIKKVLETAVFLALLLICGCNEKKESLDYQVEYIEEDNEKFPSNEESTYTAANHDYELAEKLNELYSYNYDITGYSVEISSQIRDIIKTLNLTDSRYTIEPATFFTEKMINAIVNVHNSTLYLYVTIDTEKGEVKVIYDGSVNGSMYMGLLHTDLTNEKAENIEDALLTAGIQEVCDIKEENSGKVTLNGCYSGNTYIYHINTQSIEAILNE